MTERSGFVVLTVIEGAEGWMPTFGPQVANIQTYKSMEDAATFNVGSHPDAKRGKNNPYKRVVVIPAEHWHEFEVYSESKQGLENFAAYPSRKPVMT